LRAYVSPIEAPRAAEALWDMMSDGALSLIHLDATDLGRIKQLMQKIANGK